MVSFHGPTVGIVGLGEVGSAFAELYDSARVRYSKHDPGLGVLCDPTVWDVVHVCVPAHAAASVARATRRGALVIIHSTVPVGTCEDLWRDGVRVVHAPVRGIHPNLADGLRTFVMPLGAAHPMDASEAENVLDEIGVRSEAWGGWQNTELAKLCSTTEYGWQILWMRHMADLCEKWGADFDLVYSRWHAHYNEGYFTLGRPQYMRPTLEPMPGPIGGHCVIPNADILAPDSDYARMVAETGREDWAVPRVPAVDEE